MTSHCAALVVVAVSCCAAGGAFAQGAAFTTARGSATVKGTGLAGTFTLDRAGALSVWGRGGGLVDLENAAGDMLQFSPQGTPGKFKTHPAMPLVLQVGVGPAVKIVRSAAGECTVTITRVDESGVAGSFECGKLPVTGLHNRQVGAIDGMTGSFSASR